MAYRILRKDGTRRWVQDSTMHVEIDGREYYQCTLADITDFVDQQEDLVRKNLQLIQQKDLMELMEHNMPSGYHRCKAEPGCPFTYIGQYFTEIVGFSKEEIERDFHNCFAELIWPEDAQIAKIYDGMMTKQGQGNAYDTSVYRMKHKDGTYRWVTDSTMFVDLGEESFFQGTIADITEQIENLNKAREQAEASNLAKSTFLFNASHDIRTPLNAIQGFARIIEENADNPQAVLDAVGKLKQSSNVLLTLMNDVLELSRIERGKDIVECRPVDLLAHCEHLSDMIGAEMANSGINFRMENDIRHPWVMADELKLSRIAMNLLSNARKFTPVGGTVTFSIRESDFDGEMAVYSLCVRDTGIGMSEEFQKRAFSQFERERSSTDSGISGSGLGLAIIKGIVDLMGGKCTIKSRIGEGTEITCTTPLRIAKEADQQPQYAAGDVDFGGKRLLLVEDNEFNREIARYVFRDVGFEVEEADNGAYCLEKLYQAEPGYYDLIMMDVQMPVMDGLSATQEIRRHGDMRIARCPIIAMTANAFEEDRRKCMEAGMDGHIGKPLEIDAVIQEIRRVLPH